MNRNEKTALVDELASSFDGTTAIFAVEYRGISVPQAAELRNRLRESDASFKVVKNRLAKLAAQKSGTEGLDELLTGPIALTLIKGDAVTAAKTITTFSKENEVLTYKGGIMDGEPLDPDAFLAISRLPGVDVLHGQMVGIIASPLTGLVSGLSNLISGLGRQLAQIAEQGLVSGEAPAAQETPAAEEAETAAAETPEPEPETDAAETPEPEADAAESPEPEAPVEEPTPEEPPVEEPPGEDEPAPQGAAAEEPEAGAGEPAEETSEAEASAAPDGGATKTDNEETPEED